MTEIFRSDSPTFFSTAMNDFAGLRRVKPLPKRRRTSEAGSHDVDVGLDSGRSSPTKALTQRDPGRGVADFSMPSYYYPLFSTAHGDIHKHDGGDNASPTTVDFHSGFRNVLGVANGSGGDDEDDHLDGDYIDHLQQPGNTKKRKVPAAHDLTGATFDDSSGNNPPGNEDGRVDETSGASQTENPSGFLNGSAHGNSSPLLGSSVIQPRKVRASAFTLNGLKHKEMLKSRKRQVISIVNGLSSGDSLALDQALSAHLAWYRPASAIRAGPKPKRRRLSPAVSWTSSGIPEQSFSFFCPSPTTDRLIATREEVAVLKERFENELERQAQAAAEAARNAAAANNDALHKTGQKSRGAQRKRVAATPASRNDGHRTMNGHSTHNNNNNTSTTNSPNSLDATLLPANKSRNPKKKKRSALANASNPHHLRNYVPSRLPNSGPPTNTVASHNLLGPLAYRFLSADLKPRSGATTTTNTRKGDGLQGAASNAATDEWICSNCEYDLFYGTEASFRRAVRSRKKVLRRRRRARERAARAASGVAPAGRSPTDEVETDEDGEYEGEDEGYDPHAQHGGGRGGGIGTGGGEEVDGAG